jgi:acid stress chaperone HdeB
MIATEMPAAITPYSIAVRVASGAVPLDRGEDRVRPGTQGERRRGRCGRSGDAGPSFPTAGARLSCACLRFLSNRTSQCPPLSEGRTAMEKHVMTKPKLVLLGLMLSLLPARAQVTVDVSKITCDQFMGFSITDPQNIAIWLSGYYNGKRSNTVINPQSLNEHVKAVKDYCILNPKVTVMQAVETLLGSSK